MPDETRPSLLLTRKQRSVPEPYVQLSLHTALQEIIVRFRITFFFYVTYVDFPMMVHHTSQSVPFGDNIYTMVLVYDLRVPFLG